MGAWNTKPISIAIARKKSNPWNRSEPATELGADLWSFSFFTSLHEFIGRLLFSFSSATLSCSFDSLSSIGMKIPRKVILFQPSNQSIEVGPPLLGKFA